MAAVMQDPNLPKEMADSIRSLQKKGRAVDVPGLIVWLHSVRAFVNPRVRLHVRRMWRELSRGFDHARVAAMQFQETTGQRFNLEGYDLIPKGLEPEP